MSKQETQIKGKITKKLLITSVVGSIVSTFLLSFFFGNDAVFPIFKLSFYFIWMFIMFGIMSYYSQKK